MLEIEAVYENGVLKPAKPLPLEERQHVHLTITLRATSPAPSPKPRQLGTLKGSVLHMAPDFDSIPEGFEEYVE